MIRNTKTHPSGVTGLAIGGGVVDRAPWLGPPPKKKRLT